MGAAVGGAVVVKAQDTGASGGCQRSCHIPISVGISAPGAVPHLWEEGERR